MEKICGFCEDNDGCVYLSNPVKYRCKITGKFRNATDGCNVKDRRNNNKPPLGVKPCFIQAEERIKGLADAISRYADRGDYEIIKKWAREICLQCEIAGMEKDVK